MSFLRKVNKLVPYWPLIPLYLIFIALLSSSTELFGDENRYLKYANRLLQGNYAGDPNNPDLINGPGYPLYLAFFLLLQVPLGLMKYINAISLWLSVLFVNKSLKVFASGPKVKVLTLIFALYPPFLVRTLPVLLSENMAILMTTLFIYMFIKIHYLGEKRRLNYFLASLALGMLILTRVQFAYIAVAGILLGVIYTLLMKDRKGIQSALIMIMALVVCLPYLSYTYNLTGKFFYWGTNGGEQFYWMTSPYPGQWGNWVGPQRVERNMEKFPPEQVEFILSNEERTFIETNDRYVEAALENLKAHPEAYAKNYIANIGRMTFNFPHTYEPQKLDTFFFIVSNIFFIFCLFMSLFPLYFHWRKVPYALVALVLFTLMYLGGTSLMAAVNRYVVLALPMVTIWLGYVGEKFVVIKIKRDVNQD